MLARKITKKVFTLSLVCALALWGAPLAYAEGTSEGIIGDAAYLEDATGIAGTSPVEEGQLIYDLDSPNLASLTAGTYYIAASANTSALISVADASTGEGANVEIASDVSGRYQRWVFVNNGDGTWTIQAQHSGLVLGVENSGTEPGTNVQQQTSNGSDAQKWIAEENSDGTWSFRSVLNDLYLDLANGATSSGTNVQVNTGDNSAGQCFILTGVTERVSEQVLDDGVYTIALASDGNVQLDIADASTSKGANLQIWSASSSVAQRFLVTYDSDGYYTITALCSGLVLDVESSGLVPGTNVRQWSSNGTDAQKWVIEENSDGSYSIYSKVSDLALDISGGSTSNGTNVQTYTPNGTNAQKFSFTPVQSISDGTYTIASSLSSTLVLDLDSSSTENGANIRLHTSNSTFAQKWYISYVGNGFYTIKSVSSGKMLTVAGGSSTAGTNVYQYEADGSAAQQWAIVQGDDGNYLIYSRCGGLALDAAGTTVYNNVNIQIDTITRDGTQQFAITETAPIADGIYTLASLADTSLMLSVEDASSEKGANVQLNTASGSLGQKFRFTYNEDDGSYTITALCSGYVLDVETSGTEPGTNVRQWSSNSTDAQRWYAIPADDGSFVFISKTNSLALGASDDDVQDGTDIRVYTSDGSAGQMFVLTQYDYAIETVSYSFSFTQMLNYQMTNPYLSEDQRDTVSYYLDPSNFSEGSSGFYQFLDLRTSVTTLTAAQIDAYINSDSRGASGSLAGTGQYFIEAAQEYGINEVYLLAHAIHETGWGTSTLAQGFYYEGGYINGVYYPAGTYYNFFGIGATDSNALSGGQVRAITEGWNSKEAAIKGAAKWISENYIYYSGSSYPAQYTLYSMRWHPDYSELYGTRSWHQYATSAIWAERISYFMYQCYTYTGTSPDTAIFLVPSYQ